MRRMVSWWREEDSRAPKTTRGRRVKSSGLTSSMNGDAPEDAPQAQRAVTKSKWEIAGAGSDSGFVAIARMRTFRNTEHDKQGSALRECVDLLLSID